MTVAGQTEQLVNEIRLFIEYGVEEEARPSAAELLENYQQNLVALLVLREFYTTLPEAREEAIVALEHLSESQGVYLVVASTPNHHYLTLASDDQAHILGEYGNSEVAVAVLNHFGHEDNAAFLKSCPPVADLPDFGAWAGAQGVRCPSCTAGEGEVHLLGCPVEVCPWCDGQLNRCNCRFEQLGVEEIDSDAQVEEFLERLEAKGRIPFRREQEPAYPGTSVGLDGAGQ